MKKLLVPTDFSECSNYAVDLAFQIALNNDSEIHFMHVISVPVDWVKMADDQTKLYADVNHKMHHVHGQLNALLDRADKAGLKAFKFVGYNDSFNTVIDHINHHDIDLVIMGSRGSKGLEEFLVGSNSQKIIRMSKVPVLVVKSAMKDLRVKRLLFASNYDEEMLPAYRNVIQFAKAIGCKINMVFINTPYNFTDTETIEKRIQKYVEVDPEIVNSTNVCNCYNIDEGLIKYCKRSECDLVVMITHGRTGFSRIFNRSLTETMINHCKFPVLSINAH